MVNVLTIIGAAVATAGMVSAAVGVRGRPTDDHPRCRRCRFDLTGRSATTTWCGECGADLAARRAVRVGGRRRRGAAILVGLLSLGIGGAVLGRGAYRRSGPMISYEPVWWLAHQVRVGSPTRRTMAMAELERRWRGGRLTAKQDAAVADALLAVQSDVAEPWQPTWSDFIERLYRVHQLSEDRWRRYARQYVVLTLRTRLRVRYGDRVPAELDETIRGNDWRYSPLIAWQVDVIPTLAAGAGTIAMQNRNSDHYTWDDDIGRQPMFATLRTPGVGQRSIRPVVHVTVSNCGLGGPSSVIVQYDQPVSASFTVLPPGEDSVRPADASEAGQIAARFRAWSYPDRQGREALFVVDVARRQPQMWALNVLCRCGGRVIDQGLLPPAIDDSEGVSWQVDDPTGPAAPPQQVLISCTPRMARQTVDQATYFPQGVPIRFTRQP